MIESEAFPNKKPEAMSTLEPALLVKIFLPNQNTIRFSVSKNTNLEKLKIKIEREATARLHLVCPANKQRLWYSGIEITERTILSKEMCTNGLTVSVVYLR